MGMSASQVRFLSLQSRKNDVGRQLMSLSNRKMSLSRDMNKVSQHYTEALNQKSLKWSNDAGATYNNLSYDLMMKPNDANFTVPYIVSDAVSGEVILNDDDLGLTDKNGNAIKLSYTDIAKMISSYSGVDDKGNVQYANQASYTDANGIVHGAKAQDNAYYIPDTTKDFSFDNSLRYDIFVKMGLIEQEDYDKQKNLLVALYGSASAQKDGIYPVGSAWGDYYIAQANLEAYDDFLLQKQNLSTANSYANSRQPNATLNDSDSGYNYKANVDGVNGYTNITQASRNNGAMSHIDFSKVVAKNGDDYEEVSSGNAPAGFYDKYNEGTYTGENDIQYNIEVSKNGIKYTYGIDDLYANAIGNYKDKEGYETTNEYKNYIKPLEDSINGGSGLICFRDKLNDFDWNGTDTNACKSGINNILAAYINLMKNTTTTTINSDALTKAANQTISLYMANINIDTLSADANEGSVPSRARSNATGKNGIYAARKRFCCYPWKINRARTSIYVDSKPLFNTFMSYYNYFNMNPSAKGNLTAVVDNGHGPVSNEKVLENDNDKTETGISNKNSYVKKDNNSLVYMSSYTNTEDGFTYVSRSKLVNSGIEDNAVYVKQNGSNYAISKTNDALNSYTKYYVSEEAQETLMGKDGSQFTYTMNGTTYNTYGIVTTDGAMYSLKTENAYNRFKNGESISSLKNVANAVEVVADNSTPADRYGDTIYTKPSDNYKVIINKDGSQSYYDIRVYDFVTKDVAYRSKLEKAVDNALEHIKDLEEDLKNVYGGADTKLMDYYDALFQRIAENGWKVDEHTSTGTHKNTASKYLNNKLQNNDFFVTVAKEKADETGYNYTSKLATSVTKIFEVNDDNAQNQALSKYESDKALISNKEAKIDAQMQKLETEQEAINTEMESVQKIVSDNIDKTFKMFA